MSSTPIAHHAARNQSNSRIIPNNTLISDLNKNNTEEMLTGPTTPEFLYNKQDSDEIDDLEKAEITNVRILSSKEKS